MSDVHMTIEAVWKNESTRLIAAMSRVDSIFHTASIVMFTSFMFA